MKRSRLIAPGATMPRRPRPTGRRWESEGSKTLAERADALRAEALAGDPDAAEFYGFEPHEALDGKRVSDSADSAKASDKSADAGSDAEEAQLDPEIDKALKHPQVRQAIEERIGEAEKTRQSYLNGLVAATPNCPGKFSQPVPRACKRSAGKPAGALEQMSRQDPQRFARVQR